MNQIVSQSEALQSIQAPEGGSNFIGAMAKADAVVAPDGSNDLREDTRVAIKEIAGEIDTELSEGKVNAALDVVQEFYNDAYFAGAITKDMYWNGIKRIQETWKDKIVAEEGNARPLTLWREARELFTTGGLSAEHLEEMQGRLQQKAVDFFMYEMSIKVTAIKGSDPSLIPHYKDLTLNMANGLRKQGIINYIQYVDLIKFVDNDMQMDAVAKDKVYKEFDATLRKLGVIDQ